MHDLLNAPDELSAQAAAGVEGLVRLGVLLSGHDAGGLRRMARRAARVAAEKLAEHDAGGYVRPVDVAGNVADLADACTALALALSAG